MVAPLRSEDARVDLRLQGGVRAPARARRLIEERLRGRITPAQLDELLLLTSELVTNSVRHARMGEDQLIGLRVLVGPHAVRLEVTDCGPGFARVKPRPHDLDRGGGGLGLVMLDRLAHRWGVERGERVRGMGGARPSMSASGDLHVVA